MIVLDVETTGIYPDKHSLVSLGAIDFNEPGRSFYEECRIWDGAEISTKALEINGFSEEDLKLPTKPSVDEVVREFAAWAEPISDRTLAGENPCFDRDFMKASFKRAKLAWTLGYRTVDLHSVVFAHHLHRGINIMKVDSKSDMNLDYSLKYVGLPEEPKPHNALTGALMEAEAFSRLLLGESLLEQFSCYPVPEFLKGRSK